MKFWILPLQIKKLKMRRSYKLKLALIVVLFSGVFAVAQESPRFKDVLLDGKPAKLNLSTGEITLVSEVIQKYPELQDSLIINTPQVNDSIAPTIESDFHMVKEKETLLDIANRYNTTLTELKRINNLETTLVNKGQIIRVRELNEDLMLIVADLVPSEETESKTLESNFEDSRYVKSSTNFHTVKKDETLYSLAKLYGLTVEDLKRYNYLTSNLIKAGEVLHVANFDNKM